MLLHNKLQKNYTLNQSGYQLKLPLNIETIIPENDSVRLLSQFVEEMDLTDLYSTYDRINSLSPRTLLKSLHFAPCSKRILAEVTNILFDMGEISGENIFIDGTKIEGAEH